MKRSLIAAAAFLFAVSAQARPQQDSTNDLHGFKGTTIEGKQIKSIKVHLRRDTHSHSRHSHRAKTASVADPRPRAWCGWWARQQLGIKDKAFNLARNWARIGSPAHGPAPGVIAVWRHHVGFVTAVPRPGVIVLKSGNDGHAVRERERSTRGIIAYRWPPGRLFAMQ